jgi:curved DNA-binding protein CbpA
MQMADIISKFSKHSVAIFATMLFAFITHNSFASTHYETLEIDENASTEEVGVAYRKAAKKYHPDVNPDDPLAVEKFRAATEAYHVLRDEKKRESYDQSLKTKKQPTPQQQNTQRPVPPHMFNHPDFLKYGSRGLKNVEIFKLLLNAKRKVEWSVVNYWSFDDDDQVELVKKLLQSNKDIHLDLIEEASARAVEARGLMATYKLTPDAEKRILADMDWNEYQLEFLRFLTTKGLIVNWSSLDMVKTKFAVEALMKLKTYKFPLSQQNVNAAASINSEPRFNKFIDTLKEKSGTGNIAAMFLEGCERVKSTLSSFTSR